VFPSPTNANSAFVSEFNAKGSALVFSTLLGGCYDCSGNIGYGIHADNYGNIYVVGHADSSLPTTTGAFQTTYGGGADDGFVSRIALTQANLAVTISAPSTVLSGTHLTYTIAVTNNGPNTADVVAVTDSVPKGTTFRERRCHCRIVHEAQGRGGQRQGNLYGAVARQRQRVYREHGGEGNLQIRQDRGRHRQRRFAGLRPYEQPSHGYHCGELSLWDRPPGLSGRALLACVGTSADTARRGRAPR
jgi:uncharacterized repeat protein (TIGR01451 family)